MLLVTFDFFHVFGKEISLWCCFDGEIHKGSHLLGGREGLAPAVPALGWAGTSTGSTSIGGDRKASISSFHPYERNINSETSESAGKDN